MVSGALLKVDVRPPCLAQGIDGRGDHTGQVLDRLELAELGRRQGLLNDPAQLFVVHRSAHPPSQSGSEMFERHDLEAVTPFVSSAEPKFADGHVAVGYNRSSVLVHRVSLREVADAIVGRAAVLSGNSVTAQALHGCSACECGAEQQTVKNRAIAP